MPSARTLEEDREVLKEKHALVQVDLSAGDLPAVLCPAQRVDALANKSAFFILVAVPVEHEPALDLDLIGAFPAQHPNVRDHVRYTRIRLIGPVNVSPDLVHPLLESWLVVRVPGELGAFGRQLGLHL